MDPIFETLRSSPLCWFRDWPNRDIPRAVPGVYTVWDHGGCFWYAGMAGRAIVGDSSGMRTTGLFSRLESHASGRRSGDQFCVYIADRLVLPRLKPEEIQAIAEGQLKFDALVRAYIVEHLGYRYVIVEDKSSAYRMENELRRGVLGSVPVLNPQGERRAKEAHGP